MLSFTKTEDTILVRSSYKDKGPHSTYLLVKSEDPKVLQVVNVTRTSLGVTDFTVSLKTFPGETNLTLQLSESEGRQTTLIEEIKTVRVRVFGQTEDSHFQAPIHVYTFLLVLSMILLNKCAFGCKIEFQVLETAWKRPLPILLGAVIQFFLMPFCGFLLSQILDLPKVQAFGVIMTCTCPGGGTRVW